MNIAKVGGSVQSHVDPVFRSEGLGFNTGVSVSPADKDEARRSMALTTGHGVDLRMVIPNVRLSSVIVNQYRDV